MSINQTTAPTSITIDSLSIPFSAVKRIVRSFTVLDGPNTGRLISSGAMERDVIGTFYNYSVEFDSKRLTATEYKNLYMLVSSPQESHTVVLPFNNGKITMTAYCTSGEDELVWIKAGGAKATPTRWGSLTINFIAMQAERT